MALSKDKFKKLAKKLIEVTAGDIVVQASFVFKGTPDPKNKSFSEDVQVVNKALFTKFDANEYSSSGLGQLKVEVGDVKLMVPYDSLTKDPKQSSKIVIDGDNYTLVNRSDPSKSNAVWILQLRK